MTSVVLLCNCFLPCFVSNHFVYVIQPLKQIHILSGILLCIHGHSIRRSLNNKVSSLISGDRFFFSMKHQIEYVSNFISNPLFTAPNTNSSSHKIHGSSMSFHSVTYQSLSFSRCFCFVSSSMANWRKIQSLIAIGEIFQCNDSFYKQYMKMGNFVGASNRFIHVYTKFTRSIAKLRVLVMR